MAGCPVVWGGVQLPPYLRGPLPVWMLDEYVFIFRRQCFTLRRILALLADDREARDVVKVAARGRLKALRCKMLKLALLALYVRCILEK